MKKNLFLILFAVLLSVTVKSQTQSGQYQEQLKKITANIEQKSPAMGLIEFAKTMIGVPYRYASSNPSIGFDCSGFVSYVFRNFGFKVPRSSPEFSTAGIPVKLEDAKVGDVLIFTGTNVKSRKVGHVGIIAKIQGDTIQFIHSTSGKKHGVTLTNMDRYYRTRFMKAVSLF
jgi:cell wall-associated NlpC family hydrolase